MTFFAIIPARAGSKGVPRKNLQEIQGKSLVEITIETALSTGKFLKVFLSSDDPEILKKGEQKGVVTCQRPLELARDDSRASDVVNHIISSFGDEIAQEDVIAYLQPTSPFNTTKTTAELIEQCLRHDEPIFTARKSNISLGKALYIDESKRAGALFLDADPTGNRQAQKEMIVATGACYVFKRKHFESIGDIPVLGSLTYMVNELESHDVDTEFDLQVARLLASERQNSK